MRSKFSKSILLNLSTLRPNLLQLVGKLFARNFDVALKRLVATMSAHSHNNKWVRTSQALVGAKGSARCVRL